MQPQKHINQQSNKQSGQSQNSADFKLIQHPISITQSISSCIPHDTTCISADSIQITQCDIDHTLSLETYSNKLSYFVLSTEPSRKYEKVVYNYDIANQNNKRIKISYVMKPQNTIKQKFYIVGFNNQMNKIQETFIYQNKNKDISKLVDNPTSVLYVSRHIVEVKLANDKNPKFISNPIKINIPIELNAQEIQTILQYIEKQYGNFKNIQVKKNILIVYFSQRLSSQKTYRYEINPFLVSKKMKDLPNSDPNCCKKLFKYYSITTHKPIYYTEPLSLIKFPPQTKIRFLKLFLSWVILATDNDIVFLHKDSPMDNFLNIPDLHVQGICIISSQRLVLLQYKYLHVYQMSSRRKPCLLNKIKLRKLEVFSLCSISNGDCLLGGMDHSLILDSRTQQKYVHLIKGFTQINLRLKQSVMIDDSMKICDKKQNSPIMNLTYLSATSTFVCSCQYSIYLCHFDTKCVLAHIQLKNNIGKIIEVDYPANIANILLLAGFKQTNKDLINRQKHKKQFYGLIRIGFDECSDQVGTEVENIVECGDYLKDFAYFDNKRLYTTDGKSILSFNGINNINKTTIILQQLPDENSQQKLVMEKQYSTNYKITKLVGNQNQLIFSVIREHTVEINLLQI